MLDTLELLLYVDIAPRAWLDWGAVVANNNRIEIMTIVCHTI